MKLKQLSLCDIFIAGAAVLLAACSSEEHFPGTDRGPVAVEVRGFLDGTRVESRVSGSVWEAGDAIGVSGSGTDINVRYTTSAGNGLFASESGIYIPSGGNVSLTAYYPFTSTLDASTMEIPFTEGTDFMFAGAVTATHESPEANFRFSHSMVRLHYNIIDGNRDASAAVAGEVLVSGFPTSGVFNASTGVVTPSSEGGIASAPMDSRMQAYCIVAPKATSTAVTLIIKYNGKTYNGTYTASELRAGNEYLYDVDITNADPANPVSISSASITDWSVIDGGDIHVTPGGGGDTPVEKTPAIGDYLLSDGSIVGKDSPIAGKKVAGVVFYPQNPQLSARGICEEGLDNLRRDFPACTHGIAVALTNTTSSTLAMSGTTNRDFSPWATANLASTTYLDGFESRSESAIPTVIAGYSYTKAITGYSASVGDGNSYLKKYVESLAAYGADHPVTGASSWYIPSYAELEEIYANYSLILSSIEAAGGSLPVGDTDTNDEEYWYFYYSSNLHAFGTTRSVWTHRMAEQGTPLRGFFSPSYGWLRPVIAF